MIKDSIIRLKIPDTTKEIMAIKTEAVIEFLNNFVNGSIELIQDESLRESVLDAVNAHPDYLRGYNAAATLLRDTFVQFIDKVNAVHAIADVTPGAISRIDPNSL
jgi:hypothetical protein